MSTNISKEKRENLIGKIKAIREYIAAAPQDENTGNLLTYLSEIEAYPLHKTNNSVSIIKELNYS